MAGGVEGVAVLGGWVAEGGDEEGPTEHVLVGPLHLLLRGLS